MLSVDHLLAPQRRLRRARVVLALLSAAGVMMMLLLEVSGGSSPAWLVFGAATLGVAVGVAIAHIAVRRAEAEIERLKREHAAMLPRRWRPRVVTTTPVSTDARGH